jgi:hypothetical protein
MYTPGEIEKMPVKFEKLMGDLEYRIMSDVVRRIKINKEITRAADWQIYRLMQMGESKEHIKKYIQEALKLSDKEIEGLYTGAIEEGYTRSESLYKATGQKFIPFRSNEELQQLIGATMVQTRNELKNITQSLGFATEKNGKLVFTDLADYYQNTLDSAMMDIASGTFDYNTVIKRTVQEMTKSGLRSVDYATGWSNRVEVATRRAVMTGVSQVTGKINEQNAKELDTEYFEVSWHATARPTHQIWQGKVYDKKGLEEICGLGKVDGLAGANCRHTYYPFIPGISERTYTDKELENMNTKENEKTAYGEKEYTAYEASQKQRQMETLMRKQRQDIKLLQEGEANEEDIINAKAKYRITSNEYAKFSEAMELPQQRERIYADGLKGNFGNGKGVANAVKNDIINKNIAENLNLGLKNNKEYLFLLKNSNGDKAVNVLEGKRGFVEFTSELTEIIEKSKDNSFIILHNHPSSSAFSPDDLKIIMKYKSISELKVIGHDKTLYSFSIGNSQRINVKLLEQEYRTTEQELYSKYFDKVKNNIMSKNEAWKEHSNEILKMLSEKYNWKYERKMLE